MAARILPPANVLRLHSALGYATQAAAKPSAASSLPKQEPRVTTLPNGTVVASVENYSPISRVSIGFKAGSRYESHDNLGVTHCLRNCAGLSTKEKTVFGITRNLQQIAASLTATVSRDHFNYNLECNRDNAEFALEFLNQVVTKQVFKPWEVDDWNPRMKLDVALMKQQPELRVLERLHKAAFRSGLGNSLYSPKYMIGNHEPEMLQEFVQKHFTTSRMAVVGVGVCHDYLVEFASKQIRLDTGVGAPTEPSKYGGGEIRKNKAASLAYVAIATEGASLKNPKDVLALAILQNVLGVGPNIKYSDGIASSKLAQVASKETNKPFAISALNINYSDSGLFGFYCVTQAEDTGKVLKSVLNQYFAVTKSGVSDADVQKAKTRVKAQIAFAHESSSSLLEEYGVQSLVDAKLTSLDETLKAVDSISASDVSTISKKVINGKPSMVAIGNLSHTPYLDQLL